MTEIAELGPSLETFKDEEKVISLSLETIKDAERTINEEKVIKEEGQVLSENNTPTYTIEDIRKLINQMKANIMGGPEINETGSDTTGSDEDIRENDAKGETFLKNLRVIDQGRNEESVKEWINAEKKYSFFNKDIGDKVIRRVRLKLDEGKVISKNVLIHLLFLTHSFQLEKTMSKMGIYQYHTIVRQAAMAFYYGSVISVM